jgi:hypothetical protein
MPDTIPQITSPTGGVISSPVVVVGNYEIGETVIISTQGCEADAVLASVVVSSSGKWQTQPLDLNNNMCSGTILLRACDVTGKNCTSVAVTIA